MKGTAKYKDQSEAECQKAEGQRTSKVNSLLTGAGIDDSGRFWALEGYAIIDHVEYSRKNDLEQKISNKALENACLKMHICYLHTCLYVY